jgi:Protein of unknown function (DUF3572)
MQKPSSSQSSEMIAIEILGFLAQDADRLSRFFAMTGLEPTSLRQAAQEPNFLASVLEYLLKDEALLLSFCADHGHNPQAIAALEHAFDRIKSVL